MTDFFFAESNSTLVCDLLAAAKVELIKSSVENPSLDAEWIVAHILQTGRLNLPLLSDRKLSESEVEHLADLIRRRASREPLQYVLGNSLFADLDLKVDERALIPRPETEDLLTRIVSQTKYSPDRILDLGTGSGALALGLALAFPNAEVLAVDKSPDALALAKENAIRNKLDGRVQFLVSDWFDSVEGSFDLIVSNPPYLNEKEWEECDPEVRDFEPKQALVSEVQDSAADLKRILKIALSKLRKGGILFLETGETHHPMLAELASSSGYVSPIAMTDIRNQPRFFSARRTE